MHWYRGWCPLITHKERARGAMRWNNIKRADPTEGVTPVHGLCALCWRQSNRAMRSNTSLLQFPSTGKWMEKLPTIFLSGIRPVSEVMLGCCRRDNRWYGERNYVFQSLKNYTEGRDSKDSKLLERKTRKLESNFETSRFPKELFRSWERTQDQCKFSCRSWVWVNFKWVHGNGFRHVRTLL